MQTILRTKAENADFIKLVTQLDLFLSTRDGNEHSFYDQYNKINLLMHVVVVYNDGEPAGCGALKKIEEGTIEIKRMYTIPGSRRQGIALRVLNELELWAKETGYNYCVLETGKRQPEAIRLYEKSGYQIIPNYGQYKGVENSICFRKQLP